LKQKKLKDKGSPFRVKDLMKAAGFRHQASGKKIVHHGDTEVTYSF
jgi:hypothetical protein